MVYNLTNYSTATTMLDVVVASNDITNGVFAMFMLFTFFVVLFMALKNYDTKSVFVASSFITFLVGILMWTINLISFWVVGIIGGLLVGAVVTFIFSKE